MALPLGTPPEPDHLREPIARRVEDAEFTLSGDLEWVVPIDEPAPGRVVLGTEIVSHLWAAWEDDLREAGFTYHTFATATPYAGTAIAAWALGDADWEHAVTSLRDALDDVGPRLRTDLSPTE